MMSQSRGLWQYLSQSKERMHTPKLNSRSFEKRGVRTKQIKFCHFNDSARPQAARSHLDQSNEACLKIDLLPQTRINATFVES